MPLKSVCCYAGRRDAASTFFAYQQQFRLTECRCRAKYNLYIGFLIGFSCQADTGTIPALRQASNVRRNLRPFTHGQWRRKKATTVCDECRSEYYTQASKMPSLCPNCGHLLHGYKNCSHQFEYGRCLKCFWNGATLSFLTTN
jgi:predicted RNA-binding Zn-ribbon protein involved in translation (DUF1610 family)